ncbi:hypothetical protein [Botrimarina mediterranea]|uniref:hypothetical protein n=1 Tax=Botrimarina mediterranea TaxID=2528022 RepID=UPI001188D274|nr:hypothetical protein K2D_26840 [Planctomycetes bacterium K2D]
MNETVATQLAQCRQLLLGQRPELLRAVEEARAAEAQATTLLEQLDAALAALGVETPKKRRRRKKGSPSQGALPLSKAEVHAAIEASRRERPGQTAAAIEADVAHRLSKQGRDIAGLGPLLAACFDDIRIAERRSAASLAGTPAGVVRQ